MYVRMYVCMYILIYVHNVHVCTYKLYCMLCVCVCICGLCRFLVGVSSRVSVPTVSVLLVAPPPTGALPVCSETATRLRQLH